MENHLDLSGVVRDIEDEPLKKTAGVEDLRTVLRDMGVAASAQVPIISAAMQEAKGDAKSVDWTAASIIVAALAAPEQGIAPEAAIDRVALAIRIRATPDRVVLSETEKTTVRQCVSKAFSSPVVIYRVNEALRNPSPKE